MSKKQKRQEEQEEVGAPALFAIGSNVKFGSQDWQVINYTKESDAWEVVFRLSNSKKVKRVSIKELEKLV